MSLGVNAKRSAMPWPTLSPQNKGVVMGAVDNVSDSGAMELPGIVVFDKFGNVLLSTGKLRGQPLPNAETALAQLDNVLKPVPAK